MVSYDSTFTRFAAFAMVMFHKRIYEWENSSHFCVLNFCLGVFITSRNGREPENSLGHAWIIPAFHL